ncbi:hypothetical protein [Janthinobacterium sp.]|uniref:hypothetical protein n=1 Tax=Janthinobacterium sp. TaxID=1871054 RepID=UPI0026065A46|nr:hypothetical protein [Janthinobacterium sp.]
MNIKELGKFGTSFGLIRSPCDRAASEFQSWQHSLLQQCGFELCLKKVTGTLSDEIGKLLPRTAPIVTKYLFWPLDDQWTLYFDNGVNGTDTGPPSILASRLNTDAIRVGMADEIVDAVTRQVKQYGATIFEFHSGTVERRHIFAANDGGKWKFYQAGEPFAFESVDAYKVKPVRDRFTQLMLMKYLKELGINLDGTSPESAKQGPGYLLIKQGQMPPSFREIVE